ncbi:hypothetical protein HXX76_004337 [Chlamydomonas incerta]|uniref:Uncharacterized protein n=1 Tax=Chlamydomonas incerta TaxID=51695 RepID=A0A835TM43_CHLIN|nr:hypothetical protein HXX76_004337 [Chlamydomonas incerta]|eukprot:KAG2440225.1 hypothetical protein HXX76_004337 [Chlamydomonas incerta]
MLQAKLHDLHSTDLMSLRRAYKSLAQHVQALEVESKHLPALLERAAEPSVTPEWVAGQTRLVAGVTAGVYAAGRLLAAMKVREAGPVAAALAVLGAGYVGLRLLASAGRRLVEVGRRRQAAQQELQADLRAVMERVQIMAELAESGLRLHRLHASQHTTFVEPQLPNHMPQPQPLAPPPSGPAPPQQQPSPHQQTQQWPPPAPPVAPAPAVLPLGPRELPSAPESQQQQLQAAGAAPKYPVMGYPAVPQTAG